MVSVETAKRIVELDAALREADLLLRRALDRRRVGADLRAAVIIGSHSATLTFSQKQILSNLRAQVKAAALALEVAQRGR